MWRIRQTDYDADHAAIRSVRFAVFVDEQKVPPEIEMDDRDPFCVHVLAVEDGAPVGTGRIDLAAGKVGRLAVLEKVRGRGLGTALMNSLHGIARDNSLSRVWCNAQVVAVPFYERMGYRITSEPFDEANIAHVRMERAL